MALSIQHFAEDDGPAEIIDAIERDGGAVLDTALGPGEAGALRRDATRLLAQTPRCDGIFHGYRTKRVGAMIAKSPTCRAMAMHPTVLAAMDHFLLPHCANYQINLSQLISIDPGERQQVVHLDDTMFPFVHAGHQAMLNVMWAVDDFTAANGATHIAPGSHLWPRDRLTTEQEVVQAEMAAGSCMIYLGSVRHGGGANRTACPRRGVVVSYCLGWLRQSENQYLAISPADVRAFPEPLQRLIGYFVHEPNLGMVEGQDPLAWLHDPEGLAKQGFRDFLPPEIHQWLEQHYRDKNVAA